MKGKLRLATKELTGPNGIAFSPDEKYLYVGNWDEKKKVVMRYEVSPDGGLSNGSVFFDMTGGARRGRHRRNQGGPEGEPVRLGSRAGSGSCLAEGKHLGTIVGPKHPHNFNWGDADGRTLYVCAQGSLYRMKLGIVGVRP